MKRIAAAARRRASGFEGVGGQAMAREGLASLFPIEQLSIMGLRGRRQATADDPAAHPRDRRGGDRRHRRTCSSSSTAPISPIAWRAASAPAIPRSRSSITSRPRCGPGGRAGRAAMRGYVDHVLALLPFEPEAYRRLGGPPCTYVGHPLIEQIATLAARTPTSRQRRDATPAGAAGAAGKPAQRDPASHGGVRRDARRGCSDEGVGVRSWSCRPCRICSEAVREGVASWPVQPRIVIGEDEKRAAFRIAHAALAKSGTVTLELALAGVPMVTAYRTRRGRGLDHASASIKRALGHPRQPRGRRQRRAGISASRTARRKSSRRRCARCSTESPLRRRQVEAFARLDAIMSTGRRIAERARGRYRAGDDAAT